MLARATVRSLPCTCTSQNVPPKSYLGSSEPSSSRSRLHTTTKRSAIEAQSTGRPDLAYPAHLSQPTPFELFHLPRSATKRQIKARYYDLVRQHHPDSVTASPAAMALPATPKGKGKATEHDVYIERFKKIVAAYELLKDDRRRLDYLRAGIGWSGSAPGSAAASARAGFDAHHAYDQAELWRQHDPWSNSRNPYRSRGYYPSASWDWQQDPTYDDHQESFFHRNRDAQVNTVSTNGRVFMFLATTTVLLYGWQAWNLFPSVSVLPPTQLVSSLGNAGKADEELAVDPSTARIWSNNSILQARDAHHEQSADALQNARRDARMYGEQRRDAIRKRLADLKTDELAPPNEPIKLVEAK
ncbi:uncharacterized protein L969DRAFT_89039 [Mixia osmundae IAM 14324]|uniref:J domain-containing protein n=1 Tax=Mixia osmundae (strain CBS 9802 / IAM 14324 / JCM 22182 / KY 12970) TaxID=764103 RepID=G7E825_MIXOS|nr:uncharacterized protein L969DRAFT_89039 [Mixia osmundae IAM 14324]KEI38586.1 hypothetical protein L969DRAFT_89039 [Mixia osmundae IAM 14324]GAA98985.1 hypothetical protein E5Q_05674 [Mixia osmundae IAM 14324]